MRILSIALCIALTGVACWAATPAKYSIALSDPARPVLSVKADLPCDGTELVMDRTRPGDVPEVGVRGWPAVITGLKVVDGQKDQLETIPAGPGGWKLAKPCAGRISLDYTVDLSSIAAANWPAPREAGFADASHLVFVGRSAFIETKAVSNAIITFVLPNGWQAIAPWEPEPAGSYSTSAGTDLTENLIVFTKEKPEIIKAGDFTVTVIPMGGWQKARSEVSRVINHVIPDYVSMFPGSGGRYSVVLLPMLDHGGEAYRASFAFTYESEPSAENLWDWGHTIAHEIFHRWNGYQLAGADYPSSQWFQEGFTDYMANLAMTRSGLIDGSRSLARLDIELDRYSKLTTALAHPGTHKGPPLYGGGALVALCWDILIRNATDGRRNIRDIWPILLRQTDGGKRGYTSDDITSAAGQLASYDWKNFYLQYVDATQRLPLEQVLPLAGLRLDPTATRIEADPSASGKALRIRRALFFK